MATIRKIGDVRFDKCPAFLAIIAATIMIVSEAKIITNINEKVNENSYHFTCANDLKFGWDRDFT